MGLTDQIRLGGSIFPGGSPAISRVMRLPVQDLPAGPPNFPANFPGNSFHAKSISLGIPREMPKIPREMDSTGNGFPGKCPKFPGEWIPREIRLVSREIHGEPWHSRNAPPHFLDDPFPATTPPDLPVDQSRRHPGGPDGYWVGAALISHSPGESLDQRRRDASDRVAS